MIQDLNQSNVQPHALEIFASVIKHTIFYLSITTLLKLLDALYGLRESGDWLLIR